MKHFLIFCTIYFLFHGIPCFGQIAEKNYKIFSVKESKEVNLDSIVESMKSYDVLFFGEEHNDSVSHFLENKILEMLYARYNNTIALSMEMFERDVQTVMNEYLKGDIREKNFLKDARVWSNYRDYKPMIEFAKNKGLDVVCANAAGRYSNLVGRKGQKALMALGNESKRNFAPLPYDTAAGKYHDKLMSLTHSPSPAKDSTKIKDTSTKKAPAMMPMGGYNLIMGQSLWDATMAYSISEYLKNNKSKKVFQINGRFHSDEGYAAVTQLKKYSPRSKSIVISTGSDESFPNIDWTKYKELGDFIIITDPSIPKTYKE